VHRAGPQGSTVFAYDARLPAGVASWWISSLRTRRIRSRAEAQRRAEYPFHDRTVAVTRCGRVCFGSRKINLSTVFAGQNVDVKEVEEKVWLISFMHYDPGVLRP